MSTKRCQLETVLNKKFNEREEIEGKIKATAASSQCGSKPASSDEVNEMLTDINVTVSTNNLFYNKLKQYEDKLKLRLQRCRRDIQEIRTARENLSKRKFTRKKSDKNSSFDSDDEMDDCKKGFLRTKASKYWTILQKVRFRELMLKLSKDIKNIELLQKILNIMGQGKSDESQKEVLASLYKEVNRLPDMKLEEIAQPIDVDYDWTMIARKLKFNHHPCAYKALWQQYMHPSINKGTWYKEEIEQLYELALKHRFQGWGDIAKELNTGRSAFQCYVVYISVIFPSKRKGQRWTKEEKETLIKLIQTHKVNYGSISWPIVLSTMKYRTRKQIYNKYITLQEKKKGRFSPAEDASILQYVKKYGNNFKHIQSVLPERSKTQCRNRYKLLLKSSKSCEWTVEQDKLLLKLIAEQEEEEEEHPKRNFSILIQHFPGYDRVSLRQRYLTLQKWIKKHPNGDIKNAPRKKARNIKRGYNADPMPIPECDTV